MLGLDTNQYILTHLVAEIKYTGLDSKQAYELVFLPMQARYLELVEQQNWTEAQNLIHELIIYNIVAWGTFKC